MHHRGPWVLVDIGLGNEKRPVSVKTSENALCANHWVSNTLHADPQLCDAPFAISLITLIVLKARLARLI